MESEESHQGESNSRPAAYKAAALPTELWWRDASMVAERKSISRTLQVHDRMLLSILETVQKALFALPRVLEDA